MLLRIFLRCALAVFFGVGIAASGASAQPKYGGQVVVSMPQDPPAVDPLQSYAFPDRQFSAPVYEALFDINPQGKAVPFLAQSYEVSEDLKTWRITLRPNIRFHDGTVLDAAAVVANLDRTSNPENRCRCLSMLADVKGWKVIDPLTVEISLAVPNAAFPTTLADAPGMMVSPTAFKADPQGIMTSPVGTGPFKFVEWVRNSRYVLERNPDYWQEGKPYLDRVIFRGIQNAETRQSTFLAGQSDIILWASAEFVSRMQKDKRHVVLEPAGFGTDGVYFNTLKPPLDDIRVRKAIAHAMDRDLLIRSLVFGVTTPSYSPFGRGIADVKQPVDIYPEYDPEKAKALLADYGKPVAFTLSYNNSPPGTRFAQAVQQMWAQVGIQATLNPLDVNRLIQNMLSKQFEAALYRNTGRADPDANAYSFFHSRYAHVTPSLNFGAYANPKVDELLERGRSTANPEERAAIYSELARVLVQDVMPYAWTTNVGDKIVTKRHVKGIVVIPDGLVRFADVWRE